MTKENPTYLLCADYHMQIDHVKCVETIPIWCGPDKDIALQKYHEEVERTLSASDFHNYLMVFTGTYWEIIEEEERDEKET